MENGVVNLLNNTNTNLFKLTLCCILDEGPLKARITNKDIKILNLRQKAGKRYFLIPKLAMLFHELRVDIVHTHNFYTGAYGIPAGKLARVPVIIHGEHGGFKNMGSRKYNLVNLLFRMCDGILTVSYSLKQEILEVNPKFEKKIHTIINGVDTNIFKKRSNEGVKEEKSLIIGTVGRLAPEKDYQTLIKAFKNVSLNSQNTILRIVGSGEIEEELKQLSRELEIGDRVEFMGQRNDVPDILRDFDIFVLSSIQEGCSNVILEAFSTGIPVIASNVGDNKILLEKGGGILIKPADVDELSNALKILIENKSKRLELGDEAYNWITQNRGINHMITDYNNLYKNLYSIKKGINL